jgi:hypothetical protein
MQFITECLVEYASSPLDNNKKDIQDYFNSKFFDFEIVYDTNPTKSESSGDILDRKSNERVTF